MDFSALVMIYEDVVKKIKFLLAFHNPSLLTECYANS